MSFAGLTLAISDKPDPERDAVAGAWEAGGGEVIRVGKFWRPPEVDPSAVRLYGGSSFCVVLAQKWNLHLVSPDDLLLVGLDSEWLRRTVEARTLADAESLPYPAFVKSAVPKLFSAMVFEDARALQAETEGLDADTVLLVSEVVEFVAEARAFVLNSEVVTTAVYEGEADQAVAAEFIASFVSVTGSLPRTLVLDAGLIPGKGWALVEANASWGAGLNGCDPAQAARCIAEATSPRG